MHSQPLSFDKSTWLRGLPSGLGIQRPQSTHLSRCLRPTSWSISTANLFIRSKFPDRKYSCRTSGNVGKTSAGSRPPGPIRSSLDIRCMASTSGTVEDLFAGSDQFLPVSTVFGPPPIAEVSTGTAARSDRLLLASSASSQSDCQSPCLMSCSGFRCLSGLYPRGLPQVLQFSMFSVFRVCAQSSHFHCRSGFPAAPPEADGDEAGRMSVARLSPTEA
mmetsp:Transcript_28801/g.56307  ORF Transcript_28801/g.56307 Transcript_28801/m.56307 type:complete len:218 (-) Transcript_28801:941-1594(-)